MPTDDIAPGAPAQNGHASRLDKLRARRIAAEIARDAAKASITEDDRAEIDERKAIELVEEERQEIEHEKRKVDLERREEAARERHGESAKIGTLLVDGYPDTFVLMHVGRAFAKWEHDVQAAAKNRKGDTAEITRAYALASVIDWNGVTDFTTAGHRLVEFLKAHPAIATLITNEAARLAGLFAESRKS